MRGIFDFFNTSNTNQQKLHELWIEIGKKNIGQYYNEEFKSLNKTASKEKENLSKQLLSQHNQMTSTITYLLTKFKSQTTQFQTNALDSHKNLSQTLIKTHQLFLYEYLYRSELAQEEKQERTLINTAASLNYTSLLLPSLFELWCEDTFARGKRMIKHKKFLKETEILSLKEHDQIHDQEFDLVENDDIQEDADKNPSMQSNKM